MIYPAMTHIATENHHCCWENSLFRLGHRLTRYQYSFHSLVTRLYQQKSTKPLRRPTALPRCRAAGFVDDVRQLSHQLLRRLRTAAGHDLWHQVLGCVEWNSSFHFKSCRKSYIYISCSINIPYNVYMCIYNYINKGYFMILSILRHTAPMFCCLHLAVLWDLGHLNKDLWPSRWNAPSTTCHNDPKIYQWMHRSIWMEKANMIDMFKNSAVLLGYVDTNEIAKNY